MIFPGTTNWSGFQVGDQQVRIQLHTTVHAPNQGFLDVQRTSTPLGTVLLRMSVPWLILVGALGLDGSPSPGISQWYIRSETAFEGRSLAWSYSWCREEGCPQGPRQGEQAHDGVLDGQVGMPQCQLAGRALRETGSHAPALAHKMGWKCRVRFAPPFEQW